MDGAAETSNSAHTFGDSNPPPEKETFESFDFDTNLDQKQQASSDPLDGTGNTDITADAPQYLPSPKRPRLFEDVMERSSKPSTTGPTSPLIDFGNFNPKDNVSDSDECYTEFFMDGGKTIQSQDNNTTTLENNNNTLSSINLPSSLSTLDVMPTVVTPNSEDKVVSFSHENLLSLGHNFSPTAFEGLYKIGDKGVNQAHAYICDNFVVTNFDVAETENVSHLKLTQSQIQTGNSRKGELHKGQQKLVCKCCLKVYGRNVMFVQGGAVCNFTNTNSLLRQIRERGRDHLLGCENVPEATKSAYRKAAEVAKNTTNAAMNRLIGDKNGTTRCHYDMAEQRVIFHNPITMKNN